MFAVIKTGGKQYRVAADDVVTVGKLAGERGDAVTFDTVLMVTGEGAPKIGTSAVGGLTVTGEVVSTPAATRSSPSRSVAARIRAASAATAGTTLWCASNRSAHPAASRRIERENSHGPEESRRLLAERARSECRCLGAQEFGDESVIAGTSSSASAAPKGIRRQCRHGQGPHPVRPRRGARALSHESWPRLCVGRPDARGGRVDAGADEGASPDPYRTGGKAPKRPSKRRSFDPGRGGGIHLPFVVSGLSIRARWIGAALCFPTSPVTTCPLGTRRLWLRWPRHGDVQPSASRR